MKKKTFQLSVNGQSLRFTEEQIAPLQSALEEAAKNPGTVARRSGQFGSVEAQLETTLDAPVDQGNRMTSRNIQLTDC